MKPEKESSEGDSFGEIEKVFRALRTRGAELNAFEGLLSEVAVALNDVVKILEKAHKAPAPAAAAPLDAQALGQAIAAALANVQIKAGDVSVKVPEIRLPEIRLPEIKLPAAAKAGGDWTTLDVVINRDTYGNGPAQSLTITRK